MKSVEQQDVQNFHCQRERIKKERTALVNQIRGLLAEYGVVINKGVAAVRKALPETLEDAENGLTPLTRELFAESLEELRAIDKRFEQCERRIKSLNQNNEICQRLDDILGIGPLTASAAFFKIVVTEQLRKQRKHIATLMDVLIVQRIVIQNKVFKDLIKSSSGGSRKS